MMLLEIAVSNLRAAIAAQEAGAHRIELCDNLREGGTTPSLGYLKVAMQALSIPVFPIVRPRGGNFVYDDAEVAMMREDTIALRELGFKGMVTGLLDEKGNVDTANTELLVHDAGPMDVTFHRAFDRANDPFKALEDIIACGCTRILTSGQTPSAPDGTRLIKQLIQKAEGRIIIMPGSGVRSVNLQQLIDETGATEYHSSAKKTKEDDVYYHHPNFPQADGVYDTVDEPEIRSMLHILNK